MKQQVLVLGSDRIIGDALEFLLLGRAAVRHAYAASDAEGDRVDVVVATDPGLEEHVRDVLVHPRIGDVPIVALTAAPAVVRGAPQIHLVDTRAPDVLDTLTELVSFLLARACHPSRAITADVAGAA
jgi:hypothetical protein